MQALGTLGDRMRFETTLELKLVGNVSSLNEGAIKSRLARHLPGVSARQITLSAKESQNQDIAHKATKATSLFRSPAERMRDRLMQKIGANRGVVTDLTATILTSNVAKSKAMLVKLKSHTERSMTAVMGDTLGDSTYIHSVTAKQTSDICQSGMRRRLLAYAQFWQRMADQNMTLLIFSVLLVLSILPILQLQTAILFNRAFAAILERKIHKSELLDDLYTPGLFYQVEAEESSDAKSPGSTFGRTMRGLRQGALTLGRKGRAPRSRLANDVPRSTGGPFEDVRPSKCASRKNNTISV